MLIKILLTVLIVGLSEGLVIYECDTWPSYSIDNYYYAWPCYGSSNLTTLPKPKGWICPIDGTNRHCPSMSLLTRNSLKCEKDEDCSKHKSIYEVKCCEDSCFGRKLCRNSVPDY